ncbi:MAG: helicase HerA domain-containing protein, partial [Aquificaceae bacterium]
MDNESLLESLIQVVSLAEKDVKIVSAWIKGDTLERVLDKLKKNVQVEVILKAGEREDMNITDIRVFRAVRKKGGKVYVNPRLHAKFLLVDDRIAFVGSANLTYSGTQTEFGNFEAVVRLEKEYVEGLIKKYEELRRESEEIFPNTAAIAISFENSLTFRALLLEDVPEQSFLKVQRERGTILCKLVSVESYAFDESQLMGKDKDKDWLVAFLKAYFNETGNIKLGSVRVLCEYRRIRVEEKESYFGVPLLPLAVGTQLFLTDQSDPDMQAIMSINMSGYPMDKRVYIGKLLNTNVDVYLDLSKVSSMHMAIMGATGAGKTTFVRRLIENLGKNHAKVCVMDVFGEYYEKLSVDRERMEYVKLPYTLFPVHVDDVKELFKAYGVGIQEKSLEEKNFFANIRRVLKPDIETVAYRDKNFEEILLTSAPSSRIEEEIEDFLRILKRDFGDVSVNNQREIYRLIKMGL